MPGSLIPRQMAESIYDIRPEFLQSLGIRFVMLDVDNTIAPYGFDEATPELLRWAEDMKGAGIELFILSNNRGHRPMLFAEALGIGYAGRAWKPFAKVARRVLKERGIPPENAAVIGDQVWTDGLCAALAGMASIVVRPIDLSQPILHARYGTEYPFRLIYQIKERQKK